MATTASPLPPPSPSPAGTPSNSNTTTTTPSSHPHDDNNPFTFPPHHSFPPFFTLQPNPTTRSSQLHSWSTLIQSYAQHHRLFTLSLVDALPTPLFSNTAIHRRLSLRDASAIVSWMASPEGGRRAEWIAPASSTTSTISSAVTAAMRDAGAADAGGKGTAAGEGGRFFVYWRRPDEWERVVEEWVDRTAQRGTVLTLYELVQGDASRREEFWGMDTELLGRVLAGCVRRGRAQVFGTEGGEGVKFF